MRENYITSSDRLEIEAKNMTENKEEMTIRQFEVEILNEVIRPANKWIKNALETNELTDLEKAECLKAYASITLSVVENICF